MACQPLFPFLLHAFLRAPGAAFSGQRLQNDLVGGKGVVVSPHFPIGRAISTADGLIHLEDETDRNRQRRQ
ncbi:hypothetical protein TYRP_020182 [Tyrophagus putrescentiae]|nr:hypothetical protein TYRP_020182 [Tyrophagus putrescentiae]